MRRRQVQGHDSDPAGKKCTDNRKGKRSGGKNGSKRNIMADEKTSIRKRVRGTEKSVTWDGNRRCRKSGLL